jgi:hypothetical protein
MGVGPPRGSAREIFGIFFSCKTLFQRDWRRRRRRKNFKISDLSNSNSNRTKSLAAVEKNSKILDFFQLGLRVLDFFAAVFGIQKKSLAAVEKILKF